MASGTAASASGATVRHLRDLFGGGSVAGLDDGQVLARYAATGDGPAFEALVARHGPMVLATARSVLKDEHDAEDAFQATFLVLARKAGSVRAGTALGAWLHRVARRAAVQASVESRRRRGREAGAPALAATVPAPAPTGPDFDLRAILHEEIDRLPERRRLPVVLCDLEGLTYEEAARRLRWTIPTLRNRLSQARRRLRDRLTRRGVTATALGVALAPGAATARAAVPEAMARAALAAATGGASATAGAAALTHIILKGMLMTKLKIAATAALAATAMVTAGVVAIGKIGADGPAPPPPANAAAGVPEAIREAPEPVPKSEPVEVVEVRGLVVAPDGKPVAGATLRPSFYDDEVKPVPEARSGPDGRFLIRVPRTARQSSMHEGINSFPWLVASAPGFGPGHVTGIFQAKGGEDRTVKLVEGGPPIEGRIVDLEGRPVAGARVKLERLFGSEGALSPWIAKARDGAIDGIWRNLDQLPITSEAATGPDGRFRLDGIGRDRIAELLVSGPSIATANLFVLGRDEPEIRTTDRSWVEPRPLVVHAPKFEHAVAPAKIIAGVVRDKDSGRPVAGAKIRGMVFEESSLVPAPGVEATTDAEGRYRLTGLAKGDAYRLFVEPARGQPYLNASLKVPAGSPGLEPVAFDVAMKRGVLVRGRVTDRATAKPASGYVNAYAFADNPHLGEFPGFSDSYPPRAEIRGDGRYEVVALPGRGIIAARGSLALYRGSLGAGAIGGFDPKMQAFRTEPQRCNVGDYHVLAAADLDPRAESATLDLEVDSGRSLTINAEDPEGRPIGGTKAAGVTDLFSAVDYEQESPSILVHALDPSKPRRVTVAHAGRKLVGSAYLKGDESSPITLKLRPWGTVAGRIVDDEGRPLKGMALISARGTRPARPETTGILPGTTWGNGLLIGSDGRFHVEGLVPGLIYAASANNGMARIYGELFEGVIVAPGEVKELGDLKVIPPKRDGQE